MTTARQRRQVRARHLVRLAAQRPFLVRRRYVPVHVRLIAGLLAMIAIGTGLLLLPGMTTRPITLLDALFTATSAVCVTGLTVLTTATDFTVAGKIVLLLLIQFGGLGFMVLIVAAMRVMHIQMNMLDRKALTSSLGLAAPGTIIPIFWRSLLVILSIEAIGALLLYVYWRFAGIVTAEEAPLFAIFHAVSAFCNAGFDLFTGLPGHASDPGFDAPTMLLLGTLVVLGGLGIPVFMDFLRGTRHPLSLHTRITLVTSAILILLGWAGLLISEYRLGGVLAQHSLLERTVDAWFQSVSARTAGYTGLSGFTDLRQESRLLIAALMFIGSAPASMGGGITTGVFAVMMLAVWNYANGSTVVRVWHRRIAHELVLRAAVILVLGIFAVVVASWLLLATNDISLDRGVFEVISAFSTTGLSLGVTPDLNITGRLLIIAMMIWGRAGSITIALVLIQRRPPQRLIEYAEESVLVG